MKILYMGYYLDMQKINQKRTKVLIQLPDNDLQAIRALPGFGRGAEDITVQSFVANAVSLLLLCYKQGVDIYDVIKYINKGASDGNAAG